MEADACPSRGFGPSPRTSEQCFTNTEFSCIDLKLMPATVTALVGRSGCGKTTLLDLAGAIDFPSSGEVLIDGRVTSTLGERRTDRSSPDAYWLRFPVVSASAHADGSGKRGAAVAPCGKA